MKRKTAYNKRRKPSGPPPGFLPHPTVRYIDDKGKKRVKFRFSKKVQKAYHDYINGAIKDFADCMGAHPVTKGILIDTDIHKNKDGSIDGQVVLSGIPRNLTVRKVMISLSECLPQKYTQFVWVSFGFRWPMADDEDDERYDHFKGLNQTFAYPQRGDVVQARHIPTVRGILEKVSKAGWKKPTQIIVRFNWNPDNMQPKKLKKRKGKHGKRNRR